VHSPDVIEAIHFIQVQDSLIIGSKMVRINQQTIKSLDTNLLSSFKYSIINELSFTKRWHLKCMYYFADEGIYAL